MTKSDFIYTTYIQTTPEKVWNAITNPEFTRQYWNNENISDWQQGSDWKHINNSGTVYVIGKVIESTPPRRLVLSWAEPANPSDVSQVSFDIETTADGIVCLSVVHSELSAEMGGKVSGGWPRVLSNMKSLLETGKTIDVWTGKPSCGAKAA